VSNARLRYLVRPLPSELKAGDSDAPVGTQLGKINHKAAVFYAHYLARSWNARAWVVKSKTSPGVWWVGLW